jgi:S1-C subfamily serine protease
MSFPAAQAAAPVAVTPVTGLPDFADLVDKVGPAVVNIRTTDRVRLDQGGPDQELAMAALLTPEGAHTWDTFHLIGDTLRATPPPDVSPGFAERLAARLAAEPVPGKRTAVAPEASGAPAVAASSD